MTPLRPGIPARPLGSEVVEATPDVDRLDVDRLQAQRGERRVAELAELGVLTASLLHELRQPLFAVKGRLQLARHVGRGVDAEDVELLLHHVAHIEELVEHYAGLGRPDDSWTEVDVRSEVRVALQMLAHRARLIDATVDADMGDEVLAVRGRTVAVRQVILNLLGNALDAVDGRTVRRVIVAARREGDQIVVRVSDSGPGIPATHRARLFEPFFTTKPSGHGTGLGLYIARKLLDELGGTLALDESPGGGAQLVVALPSIPAPLGGIDLG